MCGILAYYNTRGERVDRSREEIVRLRDTMRSRGPDSEGYLEADDGSWVLAHRRLAILDLSDNARQPMSDVARRIHLCYNGEIYNYMELRSRLADAGVSFHSTSDTEVILNLYKRYGTDCFRMLEGMFALVVVDEDRRRAVIARDPVGKKPVYYALIRDNLVVASDPGTISMDRMYEKAINLEGLYQVLTMGGVKSPDALFRDIHKLEPGCYREFTDDGRPVPPPVRFFDFALQPKQDLVDSDGAVEVLDGLLDRAVEKRMISDVPFGVFLSGGIDSALIVSYMSRHTDRVNTFSIDLAASADSKRETGIASEVAKQFDTNHHSVQLADAEYIDILDRVVLRNSTMAIPDSVLLAKLAELAHGSGVTVIETGEGADELFLGYEGYLAALNRSYAKLRRFRGFVSPLVARVACMFGTGARKDRVSYLADGVDARASGGLLSDFLYEPFFSYQSERVLRRRYGYAVRNKKFSLLNSAIASRVDDAGRYAPSSLSVLWNASFRWCDFLLNRIDNFTMSSSVEARAPFLDVDVINFALSLADRMKVRNGRPKHVLRVIAEKRISKRYADLPKRGFGGGNDNMLDDAICRFLKDKVVSSPSYRHGPLIDLRDVDSRSQLFTLASLHSWIDKWM